MKTKRFFLTISLGILLSVIILPLQAAPDRDNPTEADATWIYTFALCNPDTHQIITLEMPVLQATINHKPTHCRTEGARGEDPIPLDHNHWLKDWGTPCWTGVNEYWDVRFWEGIKTIRIANASFDHKTCTEYALIESSHSVGLYNFQLIGSAWETVFSNDLDEVAPGEVENGDILSYSFAEEQGHETLVDIAVGGEPYATKWCWAASGVYWTQPDSVGVDPYDTPSCVANHSIGDYIYNVNWTWDPDYCTDPTIYSD